MCTQGVTSMVISSLSAACSMRAMSSSSATIPAASALVARVCCGLVSARGATDLWSIVPDPAEGNSTAHSRTRTARRAEDTWRLV